MLAFLEKMEGLSCWLSSQSQAFCHMIYFSLSVQPLFKVPRQNKYPGKDDIKVAV